MAETKSGKTLAAEADAALAELADVPMAALNAPTHDVIGRELPADSDKARAQAREAIQIRDKRVAVDVARTQRGLQPKYATE